MRKLAHFLFLLISLAMTLFCTLTVFAYYESSTENTSNVFIIQESSSDLKISWCDYPGDGDSEEEGDGGSEEEGDGGVEGESSIETSDNAIFVCIFDEAFGKGSVLDLDFSINSSKCQQAFNYVYYSGSDSIAGFELVITDGSTCLSDMGVIGLPTAIVGDVATGVWLSGSLSNVDINTPYVGECYRIRPKLDNETVVNVNIYTVVDNGEAIAQNVIHMSVGDQYLVQDDSAWINEYTTLDNVYYIINGSSQRVPAEVGDVVTLGEQDIDVYYNYHRQITKVNLYSNKHSLMSAWPDYVQTWEQQSVYIPTGSTIGENKDKFPKAVEEQGFKVKGYNTSDYGEYTERYYDTMLSDQYKLVGHRVYNNDNYEYEINLYYTWWRPGYVHYDNRWGRYIENKPGVTKFKKSTSKPSSYSRSLDPSRLTDGSIQIWTEGDTIYWWSEIGEIIFYEDTTPCFNGHSYLEQIDLSNLNVSLCKQLNNMFNGCSSLEAIDLSVLDLRDRSSLKSCFEGCSNLTSIVFPSDYNITLDNAERMFYNCRSLKRLDLSNIQVITERGSFAEMFKGCVNLTSINYSNQFKPASTYIIDNYNQMYYMCPANKPSSTIWSGQWTSDGSYVVDKNRLFDFRYKAGSDYYPCSHGTIYAGAGKSFNQLNKDFPEPGKQYTDDIFIEWRMFEQVYADNKFKYVLGAFVDEDYVFDGGNAITTIAAINRHSNQRYIKFDTQKGSNKSQRLDTVIVTANTSMYTNNLSLPEVPVFNGYTFSGWYRYIYDSAGNKVGEVAFDVTVPIAKDITVVAKYTQK